MSPQPNFASDLLVLTSLCLFMATVAVWSMIIIEMSAPDGLIGQYRGGDTTPAFKLGGRAPIINQR